jgi:hypothetical protein
MTLATIFPPNDVPPLKVTKSLATAPCEFSVTVKVAHKTAAEELCVAAVKIKC